MNNTEETTPASSDRKRSSYMSEFLESERKKAKTCLSDTQDDKHVEDLEYMLKSAKALVNIINEIWDKCKKHLLSWEENNSSFTFEREIFEKAKVKKNDRKLKISTRKVSDTKDFGNLPSVPENLMDIFSVSHAESDVLPDYNKYLDKCVLLCEDVLLPFLTTFQEHLKEVHVYLGRIEEWLIEPGVVVSFLSKLFDKQLDDVEVGDVEKLYCSCCLDVDSKVESTHNLCTENGRKGLKAALAFVKTFKPVTQIEVKDAGEEAVNGTYTLSGGLSGGVHGYSRSGLWDGKPVTFYLYRQKNKKTWCMNCICEINGTVKFYWTKTREECELPPMNGWSIEGNNYDGVDPQPQILYKIDD